MGVSWIFLERVMGLEPTTAAMARRYSSQLSYTRTYFYARVDCIENFEKSNFLVHFFYMYVSV